MKKNWLAGLLFYTLLVILWGAWVRISHSGDGCGASWPLCQNQFLPKIEQTKTWVELSHRLMSGAFGLLVAIVSVLVHRKKSEASPELKFWAKMSLVFTISEALLGARLVLAGLVTDNDTPARAFSMGLHFVNSLMLTGSLTLCWLYAESSRWTVRSLSDFKKPSPRLMKRLFGGTFVFILLIGVTGTVAALSNTLYPTNGLLAGLMADLDPGSHYLIRLRGLHPTLGLTLGIGLTLFFYLLSEVIQEDFIQIKKRAFELSAGFGLTTILGATTLLLEAPVALKLLHLLAVHTLWILAIRLWHKTKKMAPKTLEVSK